MVVVLLCRVLQIPDEGAIYAADFSPDGELVSEMLKFQIVNSGQLLNLEIPSRLKGE